MGRIAEVFPTLPGLAGGDASPTQTGPLNGYDMWEARVHGTFAPQNEIIYNAEPVGFASVINGPTIWTGDSLARCELSASPSPRL